MIEITFNTNAWSTIIAAQKFGRGSYDTKGRPAMMFYGTTPNEKDIEQAHREWDEKQRARWEAAEPIDGEAQDVFRMELMLSIGHLADGVAGPQRRAEIHNLLGVFDEDEHVTGYNFSDAELSLHQASHRISWGEPVRVWYSDNADDYCGFLWFAAQLCEKGLPLDNIYAVKVTEWAGNYKENTIFSLGTAEADELLIQKFSRLQQHIPAEQIVLMARRWKSMEAENSVLREVIGGQPISVSEDFYDRLIWQAIDSLEGDFMVDDIYLGLIEHGCRISYTWIQYRADEFIREGKLTVTGHDPERPWGSFFRK